MTFIFKYFLLIIYLICEIKYCQLINYNINNNNSIRNKENNKIINVLFYNNPPDVIKECKQFPYLKKTTMKCRYPGHCVELLMLITDYLKLEIKPFVYNTPIIGRFEKDGTPNGLFALLANKTVDTMCKLFTKNKHTKEIFDFSRNIYTVHSSIAVRRFDKNNKDKMWNLFYPFKINTWIVISIMLITQLLMFAIITNTESKIIIKRQTTFSEFQILWRMFRVQLQQSDGFKFYSLSGRFSSFIFCLLQCLLILSLYQSCIVSTLVNKKQRLPFSSLDDLIPLIESGHYKIAAPPTNHWFFDMIQSRSDPRFKRLKMAIEKYPVELRENLTQIVELVQEGTHVAIVHYDSVLRWEALAYCDIIFIENGMPEKTVHFIFTKRSSFVKLFNKGIARESVFMHRKRWKYYDLEEQRRNRLCSDYEANIYNFKPLSILSFFGLSILLFVGFFIALFTLFVELLVFFINLKYIKRGNEFIYSIMATKKMAISLRQETLKTD